MLLNDDNNSLKDDISNMSEIKEALELLNQANDLYIEIGNSELSAQTTKNIQILNNIINK